MANIDRRIIYLLVALSLALPLRYGWVLKPAEMSTATNFFAVIDRLEPTPGKFVLLAMDWGPGTSAENEAQTEVALEHLFRKRIPVALISNYAFATPYLRAVPQRVADKLMKEETGQTWSYGKDWVNFGYRPGGLALVQQIASSDDIRATLKADALGNPLETIPLLESIRSIKDVQLLIQFTGLVGTFDNWIQFFVRDSYKPPFVHGCTSITIPDAHIYLASKQIVGLLEGVAGSAWYDYLLSEKYQRRKPGRMLLMNTGIAVAQMLILALVLIGNIGYFMGRKK